MGDDSSIVVPEDKHEADERDEPNYRGVKALPFIIGNETFEKLGTIGTIGNLLVFLTTVFNMKSITATNLLNIFNGTSNFGTLIGAFLSDTYFGRYSVLGVASVASFLGMLVLTLSAAVTKLHPPKCPADSNQCAEPTAGQLAFLLGGFGLLVIGASGIRPCTLAFGADQFNPNTESGKKGISSFFNWYYFTFTFAMGISITLIVYVQSNISWAIGLGIPAALMFFSCSFFYIGTRIYVRVSPQGSPLTSMAQVVVAAIKKRVLSLPVLSLPDQPAETLYNYISPHSTNTVLSHTQQFGWLNKAAIKSPEDEILPDGRPAEPWRLCGIQQVEEVKCVVKTVPIWISGVIYYVVLNQMQTYVVFQASQADRGLGSNNFQVPAASYAVFTMISLSLWIPIYDRIIVPFTRRFTKTGEGITILQRMGSGMVLAVLTMVVSAYFENRRRVVALTRPPVGVADHKGNISALSANWLIPQLALVGVSEACTIIAQIEFYYKEFPENMRSFAGSYLFCGFAMSSYLSSFLISVVHKVTRNSSGGNWLDQDLNKARLDYFYYFVAGLEVVNFGFFLVCAHWYKYKGTEDKSKDKDISMEDFSTKPLV